MCSRKTQNDTCRRFGSIWEKIVQFWKSGNSLRTAGAVVEEFIQFLKRWCTLGKVGTISEQNDTFLEQMEQFQNRLYNFGAFCSI